MSGATQAVVRPLSELDLSGRRVLVRVDFNVPLHAGAVADDTRIRAALPTIHAILGQRGAAVVLMSHLGRPNGQRRPELSLAPVAARLADLLAREVVMAPDCVGEAVERLARDLPAGGILLLENLRFHPEEEAGDPAFAQRLAQLGTAYVNDAFGAAHRAHASTAVMAQYLPAAAGLLMEREVAVLTQLTAAPESPFAAVIGGAKVSTKVAVLEHLLAKVDVLLIGGGMAYTFLLARGSAVGNSLVEPDLLDTAGRLPAARGAVGGTGGAAARPRGGAGGARRRCSHHHARRRHRRRSDRRGHRTAHDRGVHRPPGGGQDGDLERADGSVRGGAVRGRDVRGGAGGRELLRHHRGGGRRLGSGDQRRRRGGPYRPRVHRWRRRAGAAGRPRAARRGRATAAGTAPRRHRSQVSCRGTVNLATAPTRRRPFIAGNWKMHNTHTEAAALAAALVAAIGTPGNTPAVRVMVAPPFTALAAVGDVLRGSAIELGAQNVNPKPAGAHTGEISCAMLQALGVASVIVGHSERRHRYGEDDHLIARKAAAALAAGLEVVVCVGETLAERDRGAAETVVRRQLQAGLGAMVADKLARVSVAYEPVWAIGTGRTASVADAEAMHRQVRGVVAAMFGADAAGELVIQYGGSVHPDNAAALLACAQVDGLLVGGASLAADSFARIVACAGGQRR